MGALFYLRRRRPRLFPRGDTFVDSTICSRGFLYPFAHRHLGAVGFRRINKVDAQVKGAAHDLYRVLLGFARTQAQSAVPAAAQPHHADRQASRTQSGIVHIIPSARLFRETECPSLVSLWLTVLTDGNTILA